MNTTYKILIADDDVDMCMLLGNFLKKNGYEAKCAHKGNTAIEMLKSENFDLCICDFRLGDMDGIELIESIKELHQNLKILMITGYSDIKIAVKVIKMGVFDYLTKPILPEELLVSIKKALSTDINTSSENVNQKTSNKKTSNEYIIGNSKQSKELYKQIDLVAPTPYSVIIYGETGTGKESVARTIHERSNRADAEFIALDCGAISKELAGSELFGHEKGAFTGALFSKVGLFELANKGTIFLDEIANLPYDIQTLLLRVVQEQKVKKIGGNVEIPIDVRIIVASNENLQEAVKAGKFREDLYHRFNQFGINLAPLREREKDILLFANYFLDIANKELQKNIIGFEEEVIQSFNTYPWPGNLRELNNVIKRACLLSSGNFIESKSLPQEIVNNIHLAFSDDKKIEKKPKDISLRNAAAEAEMETIYNVLRKVEFNKTKAAKLLNIDRKTLYNKMKAFNIQNNTNNESE
jgi:two-component system, NtrC family, response regulator HydG